MTNFYICNSNALSLLSNRQFLYIGNNEAVRCLNFYALLFRNGFSVYDVGLVLVKDLTSEEVMLIRLACKIVILIDCGQCRAIEPSIRSSPLNQGKWNNTNDVW